MIEFVFVIAILLVSIAIFAVARANSVKRKFCIWVDRLGNVRCVAKGDIGDIDHFRNSVHCYLSDRADFSSKVNSHIAHGRATDEDDDFGMPDADPDDCVVIQRGH